jgi:hypothetical protein
LSKSKKNVIAEYQEQIDGKTITVKRIKPKDKKAVSYGRPNAINCPYCLSHLITDVNGVQQCSGNKLEFWNKEFNKFNKLDEHLKRKYIETISEESQFFELYDRWTFAQVPENEEKFNCGYTNKIFFPMPSGNVTIPDPVRVTHIEKKLGRLLTEEELYGEVELWQYNGSIFKEYRKGARKVKIALIRFPGDC